MSKILCESIAHALANPIINMLSHKDFQARKKAILIVYKIYKINPALVPDFEDKLKKALCD